MDSTSNLVILKGGFTVPLPALELALALERRDLRLTLQDSPQGTLLRVSDATGGKPTLTDQECAAIRQWKGHLMALVTYDPERAQSGAQSAQLAPKRQSRKSTGRA